jgi:hypothetical protein
MAHGGRRAEVDLTAAVEAVYRTCLSLAEKRRLATRLLAGGGRRDTSPEGNVVHPVVSGFDSVHTLQLVLRAAGCSGVSEAKQALRARGSDGNRLASRISKLSSLRNAAAHADVSLADDIAAFMVAFPHVVPAAKAPSRGPLLYDIFSTDEVLDGDSFMVDGVPIGGTPPVQATEPQADLLSWADILFVDVGLDDEGVGSTGAACSAPHGTLAPDTASEPQAAHSSCDGLLAAGPTLCVNQSMTVQLCMIFKGIFAQVQSLFDCSSTSTCTHRKPAPSRPAAGLSLLLFVVHFWMFWWTVSAAIDSDVVHSLVFAGAGSYDGITDPARQEGIVFTYDDGYLFEGFVRLGELPLLDTPLACTGAQGQLSHVVLGYDDGITQCRCELSDDIVTSQIFVGAGSDEMFTGGALQAEIIAACQEACISAFTLQCS